PVRDRSRVLECRRLVEIGPGGIMFAVSRSPSRWRARAPSASSTRSDYGESLSMNRRTAVSWLMASGSLALAVVVGGPALIAALSPVLRGRVGELWCPVGPLAEFPVATVHAATIELPRSDRSQTLRLRSVYVWRRDADDLIVYS